MVVYQKAEYENAEIWKRRMLIKSKQNILSWSNQLILKPDIKKLGHISQIYSKLSRT